MSQPLFLFSFKARQIQLPRTVQIAGAIEQSRGLGVGIHNYAGSRTIDHRFEARRTVQRNPPDLNASLLHHGRVSVGCIVNAENVVLGGEPGRHVVMNAQSEVADGIRSAALRVRPVPTDHPESSHWDRQRTVAVAGEHDALTASTPAEMRLL